MLWTHTPTIQPTNQPNQTRTKITLTVIVSLFLSLSVFVYCFSLWKIVLFWSNRNIQTPIWIFPRFNLIHLTSSYIQTQSRVFFFISIWNNLNSNSKSIFKSNYFRSYLRELTILHLHLHKVPRRLYHSILLVIHSWNSKHV